MDVAFSFVVPACNTAPYAEELIASLKAQSVAEFEALIVSEESSDGTPEALRRAIAGDGRFSLIELPRSGSASISRNYGMRHAKGEYLVFVDGDDWIEPDSLARFGEIIKKFHHPDLILADWIFHETRPGGETFIRAERCHWIEPGRLLDGIETMKHALAASFHTGSPLYICKREFLLRNGLWQVPSRRIQDDEWTPRVLFAARSVVYSAAAYYHYRKHCNSVTTDSSGKTVAAFTDNFFSFLNFSETHAIPPDLYRPWAKWVTRLCCMYFAPSLCRRYSREIREKEFRRLVADPVDFQRFRAVNRRAGWSRRILLPVYALARLPGCFRFGEWFYRWFYWPLAFRVLGPLKKILREGRR